MCCCIVSLPRRFLPLSFRLQKAIMATTARKLCCGKQITALEAPLPFFSKLKLKSKIPETFRCEHADRVTCPNSVLNLEGLVGPWYFTARISRIRR